jgi:hypothetical protein
MLSFPRDVPGYVLAGGAVPDGRDKARLPSRQRLVNVVAGAVEQATGNVG